MIVRLANEMYLVHRPNHFHQQQKQQQAEAAPDNGGSGGAVDVVGGEKGNPESKGEEEEAGEKKAGGEGGEAAGGGAGEDEGESAAAAHAPEDTVESVPTDLAEAVKKLMDDHFSPHCWRGISDEAATMYVDPDAFRRDCLYFEEVDEVLSARADELYVIYEVYAHESALRLREFNNALKLMCCKEFQTLFVDCGLVKQQGGSGGKVGLTDLDVRRSFTFAQMTCVNSLDRNYKNRSRDQANRATFVEFVEALCRACAVGCMFKSAPVPGAKVFLSEKLGPFLDLVVKGLGKAFWSEHQNVGIFARKIQKKFGKCRNAKVHGPEFGRHEADQSPEAVAASLRLRRGSAYRLPPGLNYMALAPVPVGEGKKKKRGKSSRKKKKK
jgi:hypothetical protein